MSLKVLLRNVKYSHFLFRWYALVPLATKFSILPNTSLHGSFVQMLVNWTRKAEDAEPGSGTAGPESEKEGVKRNAQQEQR
jgi:hypothetical protein